VLNYLDQFKDKSALYMTDDNADYISHLMDVALRYNDKSLIPILQHIAQNRKLHISIRGYAEYTIRDLEENE
jgi:hypothetical protein